MGFGRLFRQGLEIILDRPLTQKQQEGQAIPLPEPAQDTVPVGPIEQKLKAAMGKYKAMLEEKTLSSGEYFDTMFALLKEQGILKGENKLGNHAESDISIEVGIKFNNALGVEKYKGLETKHYGLPGKKLTIESAHDVAKYENVKMDAISYFLAKYGNGTAYESDFKEEFERYVVARPESAGIHSPEWIELFYDIKDNFKLGPKPRVKPIEGVPGLEDALKNL